MASTEPGGAGNLPRFAEADIGSSLREKRRALEESEHRYIELERKYQELLSSHNG